tara:strand:+ start:3192 stop:4151 length:960 start_codon:yes stop_codon:yes gene_type:complete
MANNSQHPEYQYLNLLKEILESGEIKHEHNTGIELKSVFGAQIRFNLSEGFPLLTTKKVFFKGILHELLWFIRGDSNIKYLVDNNVHIWDEWGYKRYKEAMDKGKTPKMTQDEYTAKIVQDDVFAKEWGELGPVYGVQWRAWKTSDGRVVDQLKWAIDRLKSHPDRKHYIVSAWNPEYVYEMAASPSEAMVIPPCHTLFHFRVANNKLSCQLYQRSADMFLGVPFNIASYSLLTLIMAHMTGYEPGDFVHTFGDAHIYGNHYDQVREQTAREPKSFPTITINPNKKDIDELVFEDFTLEGYEPHPSIKAPITVVGGFSK